MKRRVVLLLLITCALTSLSACVKTGGAPGERVREDEDNVSQVEEFGSGEPGEIREESVLLPGETEPSLITYEVIDGLAIYQGDIVLGEVGEDGQLGTQSIAISGSDYRWPEGEVFFELDDSVDSTMEGRILAAIAHWEANTNLVFTERESEEGHVYFTQVDEGCAAEIGYQGDRQKVWIESGCSRGNIIHEIGHAIGLWHEQSRSDRGQYIVIKWDNIIEDKKHNFDMHENDGTDVEEYDHGSLMHYPAKAFGKKDDNGNTLTTIETVPSGVFIGQRSGLSPSDIASVRRLYPEQELPFVDITLPVAGSAVDEGEDVSFNAEVIVPIGEGPDDYDISWSFEQHDGVTYFFGNGETATHSFCDGSYDITAEARHDGTGNVTTGSITIQVRDSGGSNPPAQCAPEIAILEPVSGGTYVSGGVFQLRAHIADDHPETDEPLYPVIWREGGPDGRILSQSPGNVDGSTKLGPGQHTIYVEYGSANDSVTIDVVETANTPPVATITSPADDSSFYWFDQQDGDFVHEVEVTGSGADAEDGSLGGGDLVWSYRHDGSGTWSGDQETGASATLNLPYMSCSGDTWHVRLTATDSEGLVHFDEIEIWVMSPGC